MTSQLSWDTFCKKPKIILKEPLQGKTKLPRQSTLYINMALAWMICRDELSMKLRLIIPNNLINITNLTCGTTPNLKIFGTLALNILLLSILILRHSHFGARTQPIFYSPEVRSAVQILRCFGKMVT